MIYIIGDRHGEEDGFSEQKLPGQSLWTSDDTVIVTGDFGYVMRGEWNNLPEKNKLNALAQKPYTILFVTATTKDLIILSNTRKRFATERLCVASEIMSFGFNEGIFTPSKVKHSSSWVVHTASIKLSA